MKFAPVSAESIADAVRILQEGGVVAHATETYYGFACDLANSQAVERLFAIKKRPLQQPVSALFASVDAAKQYVQWTAGAQDLADRFLPGPLTIILPLQTKPPHALFPTPQDGGTVGVRVSPHPVAQQLAAGFGRPLSTTSANLHGSPNPYSAQTIAAEFGSQDAKPDLILDSGELPPTPPSTVVDLSGGKPGTVRAGEIRV